jgi:hypothetical protein
MDRLKWILNRVINPLRSRKVRTALAGVIATYLVESGLDVTEGKVLTVLSVIVAMAAVIGGTAVEDAGAKAAGKQPGPHVPDD